LVFFGNHLGFIWQKKKTRGKSMLKENSRAYLLKTLLSENQKHKNYLKVVFGKHALRIKKNYLFPLVKIRLAKHALIPGKGSAQPLGLGFLA